MRALLPGLDRAAPLRGAQGAVPQAPALDDPERLELVRSRVLEGLWPPEQLEGRILLERPDLAVSDTTIYREVAAGMIPSM